MKPLFVHIHDGQRDVRWLKLTVCVLALVASSGVISLGLWYLVSSVWSLGALIAGLVLGVFIGVRVLARAIAYQEKELELTTSEEDR